MTASGTLGVRHVASCVLLVLTLAACKRTVTVTPARSATPSPAVLFRNVANEVGIDFTHHNGARGEFNIIEVSGSGCAFIDYDADGFLDVLLLDCGPLPGDAGAARNRLYHNERGRRFRDVTPDSGLENCGYAQGVAVGDYDNDGFDDVLITAYGGNRLFHNEEGTGKFRDATARAGVGDFDQGARYATSAAWGDFDSDGLLDLYVCHYCLWSLATEKTCHNARRERDYCSPEIYVPDVHRLYRNVGEGKFADVTKRSGISAARGRGFAVGWLDFDRDGREDVYVANDLNASMLWHNLGNGRFREIAMGAGCAFADNGSFLSGMGVGIGDYDNNGFEDLFVTNFSQRPNTLYQNNGNGHFTDVSVRSGLALPHMPFLAFGCEFFDYDADGWNDLIVGNGHVQLKVESTFEGVTYRERKQLFHNEKGSRFREIIRELGDLSRPTVARGLAVGDFDNDGRLDILVNNQNGKAELFRNEGTYGNHWVRFKTVGTKSNRNGYHAKVTVTAGGLKQYGEVRAGSSYLSHSDSRLYFGLGRAKTIERVEVQWPSGTRTELRNLPADRDYIVKEGTGIVDGLSRQVR